MAYLKYGLIFVCVVAATYAIDHGGPCTPAYGSCPNPDPLDHTVHLPHETDCTLFCRCDHGSPRLDYCPPGLHFNPDLEVCDWPANVKCATGGGDTSDSNSESSGESDSNSDSDSDSNGDSDSDSESQSGENGGSGEEPTKAPTKAPQQPSTASTPDGQGNCPAVGTCPFPDPLDHTVHLPHATECGLFCRCDHGLPKLDKCPSGLHFNPKLQVCDWPENAGCNNGGGGESGGENGGESGSGENNSSDDNSSDGSGGDSGENGGSEEHTTKAPAPPTAAPTKPPTPAPTPGGNGDCPAIGTCPFPDPLDHTVHLPHATECGLFCRCDHGLPKLDKCPSGLHFNPKLQVCDWPKNAGCSNGGGGESGSGEDNSSDDNSSDNNSSGGSGGDSGDNGGSGEQPTKAPVPPTAAPTPPPTPPPTPGGNGDCPAIGTCPFPDPLDHTVHLPHATECGLFCRCDHGLPKLDKCPSGLHFNPKLQVCDWPKNAGCSNGGGGESGSGEDNSSDDNSSDNNSSGGSGGDSGDNGGSGEQPTKAPVPPTAAPTPPPTPAPTPGGNGDCPAVGTCPFPDPLDHTVHLPHATDCGSFCRCDHGKPKLDHCPSGLHFNADLQVCDWPANAGCNSGDNNSGDSQSNSSDDSSENESNSNSDSESGSNDSNSSEDSESNENSNSNEGGNSGQATTLLPIPTSNPGTGGDCPAIGKCPFPDPLDHTVHLPHATECGLFCRCDHGIPKLDHCPSGLHFNPILEVCDWPQNAGCRSGKKLVV